MDLPDWFGGPLLLGHVGFLFPLPLMSGFGELCAQVKPKDSYTERTQPSSFKAELRLCLQWDTRANQNKI